MDMTLLYVVVFVYMLVTLYLGYLGWKGTKSAEDYMVAGRQIHPWIMALSYGATFISTSAIMRTLSYRPLHAQGTAMDRDIYETLTKKKGKDTVFVTKISVGIAILMAVALAYIMPDNIVARGTDIFFGLCAAAFLPVYTAGPFWKKATREGAIAGLFTGTFASVFMIAFMHKKESMPMGLAKMLFGRDVLFEQFPWPVVDR
ncbi:MAG: hypothetical protein WAX07_01455 [Candidatus Altiarchaeia archaeon]